MAYLAKKTRESASQRGLFLYSELANYPAVPVPVVAAVARAMSSTAAL
jgi:hypothetical protein